MKPFTLILCLVAIAAPGCKAQPVSDLTATANDQDKVLPGRHLSEHQVADIASRELLQSPGFQCQFQDGVWEIREAQKGVWGVSSATTNADGKITITSTNATRVVLLVKDADGTVEHIKTP